MRLKIQYLIYMFCVFISCNNHKEVKIHNIQYDLDRVNKAYFLDVRFDPVDEPNSLIKGDTIFRLIEGRKKLNGTQLNDLKSIFENDCIVEINYDACGTDADQGYFLFYENDKLIDVGTLNCGYSSISFINLKTSSNISILNDKCQHKMDGLIRQLK